MNNMFEMAQGGLLQTGRRCYSIRRPVADSVIFVKTLRGDTFAVRHDVRGVFLIFFFFFFVFLRC